MCGIVGYSGYLLAVPRILNCLSALEYRGYDSSGIAYLNGGKLEVAKRVGKLENLVNYLKTKTIPASCAIGHTRWATHGEPSIENAHPHTDENNVIALVHNGILENYMDIKKSLEGKGVTFYSETDTEVFAKFFSRNLFNENPELKEYYAKYYAMHNTVHNTFKISKKRIIKALKHTISMCEGAFAIAILIKGYEDTVFFAKRKSPLILGKCDESFMLASDIPALLGYTNKFYTIGDDELGFIEPNKASVFDVNLKPKKLKFHNVSIAPEQVMLGEYHHFMEKEIEEGAGSVLSTISRIEKIKALEKIPAQIFSGDFNLHISACGTALNAGLIAKYIIENQLRIPVDIDYASEFRYKKPLLNNKSVCLFISQSGETADTISCAELAKSAGATSIAITNVAATRLESITDYLIPTSAGPEIAVASTKAYLAQLVALYDFVTYVAKNKGIPLEFSMDSVKNSVIKNNGVDYSAQIGEVAGLIKDYESIYFIGRGIDYFLAVESALKLKEVSYIHCEALPAGELKHGSLALIKQDSIVIALLTQSALIEKMLNNIHEINSRGAKIILFSPFTELKPFVFKFIEVPKVNDLLAPFSIIKPLQILAYKTAVSKNLDPDKPRNLAKSVTVE